MRNTTVVLITMCKTSDIPLVAPNTNHALISSTVGEWELIDDTLSRTSEGWMGFLVYQNPDGLRVLGKAYRGSWKVCGTLIDPQTRETVPVQYESVGGIDSALGLLTDLMGGQA